MLARLRHAGLRGIDALTLTKNRSVYVSFRGKHLRVHEAFINAPAEVLNAVVLFVNGRGVERRLAKKVLVSFTIPSAHRARPVGRLHPDDLQFAERLRAEHRRLNQERFGGTLRDISVVISRRMRTRLGHYAPAASHGIAEIAISRRLIRAQGWEDVLDTLLHEMVHQWQEEEGHAVDHGPAFRDKARLVGTEPRARKKPRTNRDRVGAA